MNRRNSAAGLSGGKSQDPIQRHASVLEAARNEDYECEEPQVLQHILPQNQSPRSQQPKCNNHLAIMLDSHQQSREDILSQGCNAVPSQGLTPADLRNSAVTKRPRSQGPTGQRKIVSNQVNKRAHLMPKSRSSVREGLTSFIAKSNIDIDKLSLNLSQK